MIDPVKNRHGHHDDIFRVPWQHNKNTYPVKKKKNVGKTILSIDFYEKLNFS